MNIIDRHTTLKDIFASEGKMIDLSDGAYHSYICVPSNYDLSKVKEVEITEVERLTLLEEARKKKIKEITDYDTSNYVNGFFYNGVEYWIPRETRVSLLNSTTILMKHSIETTSLWYEDIKIDLPCNTLLNMLDMLEIYALLCFNKTAEHKANVMKLTTIKEITEYDYKIGYPEKISFNL